MISNGVVTGVAMLVLCAAAFAQDERKPEFQVVQIRLNVSGETREDGRMLPGGQFAGTNISLLTLIGFAFDVPVSAIQGGPNWVHSDRFDVVGKAAKTASNEDVRLMMQSLLAGEFKLAIHKDQKPTRVLALVVAKGGSKLQRSSDPETKLTDGNSGRPELHNCRLEDGAKDDELRHIACLGIRMAEFAEALPILGGSEIDRPVVDLTGLTGLYDLHLVWTAPSLIDQGGVTVPGAIEKQIGLKLENRTRPMPVVIIDHAERLPAN